MNSTLRVFLKEWPDHAVLVGIVKVSDRLLSLPLDTPIMKAVLGVEMLLRKLNDWEAHHASISAGTSLNAHYQRMAQVVLRWRRMEIESWPFLLSTQALGFEESASQWWFHLYRLIFRSSKALLFPGAAAEGEEEVDEDQADADEDGDGDDDEGKHDPAMMRNATFEQRKPAVESFITKLFDSLERFVQTSNVGEFPSRLEVVRAINDHVVVEKARCDATLARLQQQKEAAAGGAGVVPGEEEGGAADRHHLAFAHDGAKLNVHIRGGQGV